MTNTNKTQDQVIDTIQNWDLENIVTIGVVDEQTIMVYVRKMGVTNLPKNLDGQTILTSTFGKIRPACG